VSWYTVLTHKIFTLSTAKGSGTARRFAAAGRCLRGHTKRFRARLEGPATWLSRGIVIQAACAFETFCELVNLGSSQNPCPEHSEGFTQSIPKGSGTASRRFTGWLCLITRKPFTLSTPNDSGTTSRHLVIMKHLDEVQTISYFYESTKGT
jgi:hypothetical protein